MKIRRVKIIESKEKKATSAGTDQDEQEENDTPCKQVQELTQDVRSLLKDGKITIHSVMTTWVGSPFGAVEAFKNFNPGEIDTKFSCTIFDVIEIICNLQREDPIAFWMGGKKNTALKHLVPLATDSSRLCRKLQRITATLEGYTANLQKIADALDVFLKKSSPHCQLHLPLKNRKSGNCYKFRKAVRHALFALSGHEKKAIEAPPADEEASAGTPESAPSAPKDAPYIHIHNEIRTPERNKSDSAQRRKGCNAFNGFCQCPPHFCQKFEYQPRLRAVPSFIFYPQPFYQHQCRQQEEDCNCCENNPAGDVPQGQCHCECQCCQNQNQQQHQPAEAEIPEKSSETKVPAPTGQESQPFDVSTEGYETSYLKDYQKTRQKVGDENVAPATEEEISCDGSAIRTEYTDISALYPSNGNVDSNCNSTEEETIKEVVIVRSAVSGFAESEYGAIDSEDMEWLDKIKETGHTGVLAAEEIERSEKLKRQSIFLNCIRFRTQETLKDVQSVLKMVRDTEKRWIDTSTGTDRVNQNGEVVEIGRMELKELISAIENYCQDLTKNHSNGKKGKVGEAQVEAVRELVQNIQTEASGVHKSFQRFTKMVSADTDFLKQLCLGYSLDMCALETELKAKDRPVPEYLHWTVKEGDQVAAETESHTALNFREIFDE